MVLINVSYNIMTGTVPSSFNQFMKIQYIDLSNNAFTGNLNGKLNNSYYIASLLLQHNAFTGRIDDSLLSTKCGNLQALDFSAIYFTGKYSLITIFMYT